MRLFLAIDLGEAVRIAIGTVQQRLRERLEGWRWVEPRGIHLTVRFLGEIAPETLDRHLTAWRGAAGTKTFTCHREVAAKSGHRSAASGSRQPYLCIAFGASACKRSRY